MSGAKSISLVGWFVSSWSGFGHRVWFALPLHRVRIEGVGIAGNEACSGGNQDAVEATARFTAGAQLDAGGIDTFFVGEVLLDVEIALGCGIGLSSAECFPTMYQLRGRVAVEGEGDLVEASLSFVVDADGTLSVALEGDAAEVVVPRCHGWRWSCNCDCGVRTGLFAEIVDDVAGDVDRACWRPW